MSDEPTLTGKVISLHRLLDDAGIAHAFGGAIALAYCAEPRATKDIDINIALEPSQTEHVLAALPAGIELSGNEREIVERDGQLRLQWGRTPLDLFFGFHAFHRQLADNTRLVPFADTQIPVIDGADLVVCKAMFDRPKDWVDIDSIARNGRTDFDHALEWLVELIGPDAQQVERLRSVATSVGPAAPSVEADDRAQRVDPPEPDLGVTH